MPSPLILTIDTFTLTLSEFLPGGHERKPFEDGEMEYSLFGSALTDGPMFESKHVWTIKAICSQRQWNTLVKIYKRSERKRRADQDYKILVSDYVEPFVEDDARTRALAAGGTVVTDTDGGVSYPAVFAVRLFQPNNEKLQNTEKPYVASFVLKELDKVMP